MIWGGAQGRVYVNRQARASRGCRWRWARVGRVQLSIGLTPMPEAFAAETPARQGGREVVPAGVRITRPLAGRAGRRAGAGGDHSVDSSWRRATPQLPCAYGGLTATGRDSLFAQSAKRPAYLLQEGVGGLAGGRCGHAAPCTGDGDGPRLSSLTRRRHRH